MKIITHSGQFHADEVFACALLLEVLGDMPIDRTRDIKAESFDCMETFIVDVGLTYDPEYLCFDHHQDDDNILEAACMLVLFYLHENGHIKQRVFERLLDMFREISHIDRFGFKDMNGFQVNALIRSFNGLPNGFDLAIQTARGYVKSQILSEMLEEESRQIFDAGERIAFETVVCDQFPLFWKAYKECIFLVAPTDDKVVQWAVHSINSQQAPLVPMGNETYFDKRLFLAKYATKEEAVESAVYQCINTFG